jgi:putative transposase
MPLLPYVIALRPTPAQVTLFLKAVGCTRLAYNWGLAQWRREYQAGGKPKWMALLASTGKWPTPTQQREHWPK